jgi:hypothetical protein
MNRILFLALIVAGCSSTPAYTGNPANAPPTTAGDPGAATPTLAVAAFMAAINSQDVDALGLIWGSEKGPAVDLPAKDQLAQRAMIMQCYLKHDSYQIVNDVVASDKVHIVTLSVTKGTFVRQTTTKVFLGPNNRWFVGETELQPLKDLCSGQSSTK